MAFKKVSGKAKAKYAEMKESYIKMPMHKMPGGHMMKDSERLMMGKKGKGKAK